MITLRHTSGPGGAEHVVREDPEIKKKRNQLRRDMLADGRTYEEIATAMAEEFGDRRRVAWRNAHGWTQQHVADLFNQLIKDPRSPMTDARISDYERWPINGGSKPTPETLDILAAIYGTTRLQIVDDHDRQKMALRELASLAALEKQTSAPGKITRSRSSSAYADNVEIPQQLPNAAAYFVGRTQEFDTLTTQLDYMAPGGGPVITVVGGTAGIGKTTLAVQWAQQCSDYFPDGQLYVDLRGFHPNSTPVTPHEAIRGFLDAFHTPVEKIPTSLDAQAALYRNLVKGKRLVLVLDNARDTDQVRPLLPDSPNCMVLVTSRQQLNSLAYNGATYITLDFLSTEEARQLLIKILGPERINAEPEAVEELIQRCVHLPTALHIAAARIKAELHTSLSVLVGQLREQRQRLAALSTGDSQYFDIRAVFSWSYTALSPQAARLFRLLGLHPGPDIATLAAASLTGLSEPDTHTLLTELTRAHLIKQNTPGRYQFHDLLHVYATEQAYSEDAEDCRIESLHRLMGHYLFAAITAARYLNPHRSSITLPSPDPCIAQVALPDHRQALQWYETEYSNLIAIINRARQLKWSTYVWQLPWALLDFFLRRGHCHDWIATHRDALSAAGDLDDLDAQSRTHNNLGRAYTEIGNFEQALHHYQQALEIGQTLTGRQYDQGVTRTYCSRVCILLQRYEEALIYGQQALELFDIVDNSYGKGHALDSIALAYAKLSRYEQALVHGEQGLELFRSIGHHTGQARAYDTLGFTYGQLRRFDEAISRYQGALTLHVSTGHRNGQASTHLNLGKVLHEAADNNAARQHWQQALALYEELEHPNAEEVRACLALLDAAKR